jgi:WD40 repeat protein
LLHQYWLAVANAVGVDPYEMDVSAVAASPDGNLLAVGGCSKQLVSDLRSGSVYCTGDDTQTETGNPFLVLLDANTETVMDIIPENEPNTTVAALAFTRDGTRLIYAVQPGRFAIWDIASHQMETVLWEGQMSMPRIALSPDSKWIALKTTDEAMVWSTETNEFVATLPAYYRPEFSADSTRILVYSDNEFIIYETGTWTEQVRFANPCDCVYDFSTDLALLATSERAPSETAPILIWDTASGEQIQTLEGGRGLTSILQFSPDGKMLWRAGDRGDLSAWATDDWRLLAENIGTFLPIINLH